MGTFRWSLMCRSTTLAAPWLQVPRSVARQVLTGTGRPAALVRCSDKEAPSKLSVQGGDPRGRLSLRVALVAEGRFCSAQVDQTLLEKPAVCDAVAPGCTNGRDVEPMTLATRLYL